MAAKTVIIFCALILGSLAVPVPENNSRHPMFDSAEGTAAGRIVGGTAASVSAHPWMAAMTNGRLLRSYLCGGSIISQRTVLTAAHCINAVRSTFTGLSSSLRLTVGTSEWNRGGQELRVNGFAMHPQYRAGSNRDDIGTLFTASLIIFNDNVRVIPLSYDYVGGGVKAHVAGWGRHSNGGPISNTLFEIEVPTISGQQCVSSAQQASVDLNRAVPAVDPNIEICTFHSEGHGTCRGDSGSALVRIDSGVQIGVVSWGLPCALGAPDMFVRISAYQSWLEQNTRN